MESTSAEGGTKGTAEPWRGGKGIVVALELASEEKLELLRSIGSPAVSMTESLSESDGLIEEAGEAIVEIGEQEGERPK
jgi:hypothetical protein